MGTKTKPELAQKLNQIIIMNKLGFGRHLLRQNENSLAQMPPKDIVQLILHFKT